MEFYLFVRDLIFDKNHEFQVKTYMEAYRSGHNGPDSKSRVVSDGMGSTKPVFMDEAVKLCTQGLEIVNWASNDQGTEPDVVMAC